MKTDQRRKQGGANFRAPVLCKNGGTSPPPGSAPTTRYQGSKRKLLPWLQKCMGDRPVGSMLDLMSGTGSVAYDFKRRGWQVATNDYLRFNYLTSVALIENPSVRLSPEDIATILTEPHAEDPSYRFVQTTFNQYFFRPKEDSWIDERIAQIQALSRCYNGTELKYKQALAHHALFQAALMKRPFNLFHRRNLSLRTKRVYRSFGNKTTWETDFATLYRRLCDECNNAVFSNGKRNRAFNKPAEELDLAEHFDIVYIDPPYFAQSRERTRSDYRFLYHFLEGLAHYPDWPSLIDESDNRKALRRDYEERSPYKCPPGELHDVLDEWLGTLVKRWKKSAIMLSYKAPGIPSETAIVKLLKRHKRTVRTFRKPYTYALSKRNGKPKENIELLFIAE